MDTIVDAFLTWWLRTGRPGWSRLRRGLFERRFANAPLPSANSLQEIQALLKQVRWTMDGPLHMFDCISYPQTTWESKKDDCDGFACLAAALLLHLDPRCRPVLVTAMLRPLRSSHTVCAFDAPEGGVLFFDNDSLRREGCQGYGDVIAKVSERADRVICWDVRDPSSLDLIEFHRG